MNNIEKIRQEIERRRHDYGKRMLQPDGMVARAKFDELTGLLAFIDSLPEEKPSEDLEEAASIAAYGWQSEEDGKMTLEMFPEQFKRGFIAGAKWMSKQINNE